MLAMKTLSGYAVPIKDFDMVQKKNLRAVKYDKRQIADMEKLSTFYPEIRFKNVSRVNSDESIDIIIDAGVANEIHTGFLPKRFYKALRMRKEKGLLGSVKWSHIDTIQVSEADIISQFNQTVAIDEIETILGVITKKGVKYFG
ncbi:hypothetical protein [Enterococcus avium]|uniref:hypothetical protein n=1 Tax=Enterococcus avium TaxID=33945 RepID=UPI000F4F2413|nr:hypothetical protein [Enterococcus avium]MDT2491646.1 hypothetical protein [Enterococcus avium]ROZ34800.1 hypothetical protein EGX28_15850 [Enterococcus avium]